MEDYSDEFYRMMLMMRKQEVKEELERLEKSITKFESTFDKDQL